MKFLQKLNGVML